MIDFFFDDNYIISGKSGIVKPGYRKNLILSVRNSFRNEFNEKVLVDYKNTFSRTSGGLGA